MPQTCDRCNQIFYSETEYREHRMIEDQSVMFKEMAKANSELWAWIGSELRMGNILQIQQITASTFPDAIETYLQWIHLITPAIVKYETAKHEQ